MVPEEVVERVPSKVAASGSSPPGGLSSCSEIRCGALTMVRSSSCGCGSDVRVVLKVYRTSLEHFAVIYPDKAVCKPFGFINLKNCRVQLLRNNTRVMQIVQKSCDGGVLTFRADTPVDAKMWLDCLRLPFTGSSTSPSSSKKRMDDVLNVSLPILLEEGDEE